MRDSLRVGDVARIAHVTPKTVRYYEEIGLLPPARRGPNGYRCYSPDDVNRLAFILRAKNLGLTLEEIRDLVAVAEGGECALTQAELRQILEHKIADCTQRIESLTIFRATLEDAARRLIDDEQPSGDMCPSCVAFAPTCNCVPAPHISALDLSVKGKE